MRGIEVEDEDKSAINYLHKMIGTAVEIIIRYSVLSSKTDSLRTILMFNVIQKKTVCTYAHIKKYLHIREYETVQQKKLFDSIHFIFDISCIKIYMYDNRYSKLYT